MQLITPALVAALAPDCDAKLWAPALSAAADEFGINTKLRVAHWLSQMAHESRGFQARVESLNYSVEALIAKFGRHRISIEDARKFGRSSTRPANQSAIANLIYGGRFGLKELGNSQPGDGWKYRARGPMQNTGRANYRRAGKRLGLPLEEKPELVLEPLVGARAAGAFWADKSLNDYADQDLGDIISEKVNGGHNGLEERRELLAKAKALLR